MPNGTPRANTFLRLFAAIDPAVFGKCPVAYATTLAPDLKGHLEKCVCTVTDYLGWLPAKARGDWLGLRSLVRVETGDRIEQGKRAPGDPASALVLYGTSASREGLCQLVTVPIR